MFPNKNFDFESFSIFQSSRSIDEVRENTEFYWHFQRYSFVREYFERLPLSYPPLIVIPHIMLLFLNIRRIYFSKLSRNRMISENGVSLLKKLTRVFKMIPTSDSQNEQWDSFENAAVHSRMRSILEKNKDTLTVNHEKSSETMMKTDSKVAETTLNQEQQIETLKNELMSTCKSVLLETQRGLEDNNSRMENRFDQMKTSLEWVMNAIERMQMNDPKNPRPTFESSSTNNDISFAHQATTLTTNSVE
ncbi:unnamed protein product [Rotaria sp. Silwood2]|nr:unnamed protein product [Rotaria sp. Silwood2]CAF4557845.1 unnamed protein product [Rotaria sp. Silwood2]